MARQAQLWRVFIAGVFGVTLFATLGVATASAKAPAGGRFGGASIPLVQQRCTASASGYVITFNERLHGSGPGFAANETSEVIGVSIPAGTYTVTLVSYDAHSEHGGQSQLQEQWFLQLNPGAVSSGIIADLPEDDDWIEQGVGQITLGSAATSAQAIHKLAGQTFPTPESIEAKCAVLEPVGGGNEGCTPGFWKNHTDVWSGYTSGQTLELVFDVPNGLGLDNKTLLEALGFGGGPGTLGGAKILLRASVAALLNAAHGDVDYEIASAASVISQVNTALASNNRTTMLALASTLDGYNNAGCSIDAHGNPI